MEDALQPI